MKLHFSIPELQAKLAPDYLAALRARGQGDGNWLALSGRTWWRCGRCMNRRCGRLFRAAPRAPRTTAPPRRQFLRRSPRP